EEDEEKDSDEEVFEGILEALRLPMPVHLGKVEVDGKVLLPERSADFSLRGGGLLPGAEGRFSLAAVLAESGEAESAEIEADLTVAETENGGISAVKARVDLA